MFWFLLISLILLPLLAGLGYYLALKQRHLDKWLGSYYFPVDPPVKTTVWTSEPIELFIAVCDHYEPQREQAPKSVGLELVNCWVKDYPNLFREFRDSAGRPPQHTFFFPQDEYEPEYLDALKELCEAGFGDVDVHLHHDQDTSAGFREKLESFRETLFHRHGLLRRDPDTNDITYGFIHGNWALCNSDPYGENCGVNDELNILRETGCYADFTMPSAPSPTQISKINSIYYAWDRPGQSCSHATGQTVAVGRTQPPESLLMIQGPLVPDWKRAKWGIFPRIENGDLHADRPGSLQRLNLWLQANVHVRGRDNWKFIKLHTHGCKAGNLETLLGPETIQFHRDLANWSKNFPQLRYHYVTAWEMSRLVKAAEAGETDPLKVLKQRSGLPLKSS